MFRPNPTPRIWLFRFEDLPRGDLAALGTGPCLGNQNVLAIRQRLADTCPQIQLADITQVTHKTSRELQNWQ